MLKVCCTKRCMRKCVLKWNQNRLLCTYISMEHCFSLCFIFLLFFFFFFFISSSSSFNFLIHETQQFSYSNRFRLFASHACVYCMWLASALFIALLLICTLHRNHLKPKLLWKILLTILIMNKQLISITLIRT